MAMLTLNGLVQNCFDTPETVDRKTGEVRPAASRIQILAENILQNGQRRMELVTLKVKDSRPYAALVGKPVRVPVGALVSGSAVQFYALNEAVSEDKPRAAAWRGLRRSDGRVRSDRPPARSVPRRAKVGAGNGPYCLIHVNN